MEEPSITTEQFAEGEEIPNCPSCKKRLANLANEDNLCLHCEGQTGKHCTKDGCKADRLIDHNTCRPHAVQRLYNLYETAFQMSEELDEENEVISDMAADAHEKKIHGLESQALQREGEIRAMKNSYVHKNEELAGIADEIQHLQNLLDIHAIDFN